MKNPWLSRKKPMPLEQLIATYKENYTIETMEPLFSEFQKLAEKIVNNVKFEVINKAKAARRMVFTAWIKLHKYDPTKGRAFNFFTTIMLSQLRQDCRCARNYKELKEKYQYWLKEYGKKNKDS